MKKAKLKYWTASYGVLNIIIEAPSRKAALDIAKKKLQQQKIKIRPATDKEIRGRLQPSRFQQSR